MTNPLDFTGKVALVTGAAAGMGLATADGTREDCDRVIGGNSRGAGRRMSHELRQMGWPPLDRNLEMRR